MRANGTLSPGRDRALKTYALLFTVYCRRGTAKRRQHYQTHRPFKNCGEAATTTLSAKGAVAP